MLLPYAAPVNAKSPAVCYRPRCSRVQLWNVSLTSRRGADVDYPNDCYDRPSRHGQPSRTQLEGEMRPAHDQAAGLPVGAHASMQGQSGGIHFVRGVGQRGEYSRVPEKRGSPGDQAAQHEHQGCKGGGEGIRRSSLIGSPLEIRVRASPDVG